MIFHASFGVRDPDRVAHVLASLAGAPAVRAPTPPFPRGSWLLVFGDVRGSLLEILPAATVFDPDAPLGLRRRSGTAEPGATHVLIRAVADAEAIEEAAQREGWRVQQVETGLFKVIKLWIDDGHVLLEFLTRDQAERYAAVFSATGLLSLDKTLRALEAEMAAALAAKPPPHVIAEALG